MPDDNDRPISRHSAVVGLHWGDEGKGKIVDLLTAEHDVVVRYNGGANAGHTIVVEGNRYALHLIPSGVFSPNTMCVIGNGVVVDPFALLDEMQKLRDQGIEVGTNLRVSSRAHVVLPFHRQFDAALESMLEATGDGRLAIGTTKRGIGPAYADKVFRATAVRLGELLEPDRLREKLRILCPIQQARLNRVNAAEDAVDPDALADELIACGEALAPCITDTTYLLNDYRREGRSILFEGANACLLDVDHGTFPYVTSSNCSTLGIGPGTGMPFLPMDQVVGIMKAYNTRVGAGPFPTEQDNITGDAIRKRGNEYGTTTGRPRRCGWLDLVATRYSAMVCGATTIACMLLDVLSGLEELKLCTAYRLPDGTTTDRFPPDAAHLSEIEPIYETLPGWSEPIDEVRSRGDLPANALAYLARIEELVGVPVGIISVGPDRMQTILS